ncbi:MAG: hypothetical protein H7Y11_13105 [Armatimonadetes bacterium]|nr:hypothetical protein [Anaerolineae bacterium]
MAMALHIGLAWIVLGSVFCGIGLLVASLLHQKLNGLGDAWLAFWLGYSLSLALLQVWHLVLPIGLGASLVLACLAIIGIIRQRRPLADLLVRWRRAFQARVTWGATFVFIGLMTALAAWVLYYAQHNPPHYDDGLYHAQELAWVQSEHIIPGLGNLHGRLAFNNSFTLVAAAIGAVPGLPHPRYVINGLLLLVFIGGALWQVQKIARTRSVTPHQALYSLMLAPALYFADSINIASLKNDLPVALVLIIAAAEVVRRFEQPFKSPNRRVYHTVLITVLICGAIAVKLSGAILGVVLLLALLVDTYSRHRPDFGRTLVWMGVISVVIVGVWLGRGGILSGYPLYPSTALALPVDWRMDAVTAHQESDGVRSWARIPAGDPQTVLANWDWLPVWWQNNQVRMVELLLPLALIGLGIITVGLAMLTRRMAAPIIRASWLLPLICVPAIGFWFWSAPDTRFGWHTLWLLAVSVAWLALQRLLPAKQVSVGITALTVVLTAVILANAIATPDFSDAAAQLYPPAPIQNLYSYHGVKLHIPIYGPQCWDAAPPCTPYPNYFLERRDPTTLAAGFRLRAIEGDKTAFSLAEIIQTPDIVPLADVQHIKAGRLPTDGLLVGRGWHSLEAWDGGQQRWVENNAEIYVTAPQAKQRVLRLELAPGPSLPDPNQPFTLWLMDEDDQPVSSVLVEDALQTVEFDLLLNDERVQIFRLHLQLAGTPAPNDGRILNFRVMQISWG